MHDSQSIVVEVVESMVVVVVGIDDYHLGMVDSLGIGDSVVGGFLGMEDSHSHVGCFHSLEDCFHSHVDCFHSLEDSLDFLVELVEHNSKVGIGDSHDWVVGIAWVGFVVVGPLGVEWVDY